MAAKSEILKKMDEVDALMRKRIEATWLSNGCIGKNGNGLAR